MAYLDLYKDYISVVQPDDNCNLENPFAFANCRFATFDLYFEMMTDPDNTVEIDAITELGVILLVDIKK